MLDIGLGKNIVVLGNNDGYIIPTSKRPIIQYHDINFTNAKIIDYNDENLREKIQYFNGKDFYKIKREAKNKYSLRNNFGGMVINKLYDTIYMNEYFIVGKLNSDIEIYNTSLKKFDTKNIKAAYPKNEIFQSIQILKGNELQDLSFLGEIKQKEKVGRSVCGNVPEWNYSINDKMLTTKTSTYYRKQVEDAIIKIDLSLYFFDTVLFLNNTNEFIYDGNEFASDYIFNLPFKWLLVSKYGKYGVYEFNTDRENWDALKEIIPVEYDSIEASGYHRPLKLKKDNFYTYYNVNKKKYKTLDKYNYHFCRFENEFGKLGWLDYKGNEYYD